MTGRGQSFVEPPDGGGDVDVVESLFALATHLDFARRDPADNSCSVSAGSFLSSFQQGGIVRLNRRVDVFVAPCAACISRLSRRSRSPFALLGAPAERRLEPSVVGRTAG